MYSHHPFAEQSFRKKARNFKRSFPKFVSKSVPRLALNFLMLSWQGETSPQISRQISQISNQISPENFKMSLCRHGNPNKYNISTKRITDTFLFWKSCKQLQIQIWTPREVVKITDTDSALLKGKRRLSESQK